VVLDVCDVGHRVVIRREIGAGQGDRPRFTDLLGVLLHIDDERVVIRADGGAEHSIARHDIRAGKRVPPRPARYSEIAALELVADELWPAREHDRLGDWRLRGAAGFSSRANSALALGEPGLPINDAVAACRSWYAARQLPARIMVPLPPGRVVADALTGDGWHPAPTVLVQTADLAPVTASAPAGAGPPLTLTTTPSEAFLHTALARKAGPAGSRPELVEAATHALTAVPEVRFAEVRAPDGSLLALARGALDRHRSWLHLGLIEVAPAARRQGLARRTIGALAGWAQDHGVTRVFLQVEERNTSAVALYAGLGFTTHHRYVTYQGRASSQVPIGGGRVGRG
jgi:GNAT superfamily N-acetyltransferase